MIEENIRRKIQDLIARSGSLLVEGHLRDNHHYAQCESWITEALNVTAMAIPSTANAYRARIERGSSSNLIQRVASIAEMFRHLVMDIEAGLLGDLGDKIRADL